LTVFYLDLMNSELNVNENVYRCKHTSKGLDAGECNYAEVDQPISFSDSKMKERKSDWTVGWF